MRNLRTRTREAVRFFWRTRDAQDQKQGASGNRDQGGRSKVTGGKQLNGFSELLSALLIEAGCPESGVFHRPGRPDITLPGFYRPCKDWDLLVVLDGHLLAVIELKSHIGSMGNNCNNRAEEALGNAMDFVGAYKHGAIPSLQPRPWLGYFMLVENSETSRRPVTRVKEPHFKILPEFRNASYLKRYELLCTKMLQERLYDGACLLVSPEKEGLRDGKFSEPVPELTVAKFAGALLGHVNGYLATL